MRRTSFAGWPCPIARATDILGDWWTPLVIREAVYGVTRFDEFQSSLGLSRNVLSHRLDRLVEEGIFERMQYQMSPPRFEYLLTEKGRDLLGVLLAMAAWGDRWLDDGSGPPILVRHADCGHDVRARVVCDHCRTTLTADNIEARLGPGYPPEMRDRAQTTGRFHMDCRAARASESGTT